MEQRQNPWGVKEGTTFKRFGIIYSYVYDLCYRDWFLWDGLTLHRVSELNRNLFDLVEGIDVRTYMGGLFR